MPEVIYAKGKTADQVARIFASMSAAGSNVLATRASREQFEAVLAVEPRAIFHELAACVTLKQDSRPPTPGVVAVLCAGTRGPPPMGITMAPGPPPGRNVNSERTSILVGKAFTSAR